MAAVYFYRGQKELTCYEKIQTWVKNNPTTLKAIAAAGAVLGGALLVAATASFISLSAMVILIAVGGGISVISAVADSYFDHQFQWKLLEEELKRKGKV